MVATGNVRRDTQGAGPEPAALLGAVIALSDDAIFTCDAESRVSTWSATAERLFGRLTAQVMRQPVKALFPDHLCDEVEDVIATVLRGDRVRHFETEVRRPDGMPLPVSLSLGPVLGGSGTPAGAVAVSYTHLDVYKRQ